ncbi:MAG TPA: VOC family protein [Solirubrobacteraceae bacterium]
MAQRTKYTPGTFSWADLTTPDQSLAKSFYGELFGWEAEDLPIGDGVFYSMMRLDGKDVAAISPQQREQREAGAPPAWNSYLTVESADAAVDRAKELGGTVHAPVFDVMDAGRMGVVQDPQGAFFLVWEPKANIGAALVNAPGALTWNELACSDMDAAERFYSDLFGWALTSLEDMPMPYSTIKTAAGSTNGGMRPAMEGEPSHWLVYFGTDDIDASIEKLRELGGDTITDAMDIGVGKIAIVRDAQGAVFALYSGDFED